MTNLFPVSRFYKIGALAAVLSSVLLLGQNSAFAAQTITGTTINATTLNATTIVGTYTGTLGAANVSAGIFGSNTGGGTFIFPASAGIQSNAYNNTGYLAFDNNSTYWGIIGNYGINDWRIGWGSPTALTGWNLRWDASGNVWVANALTATSLAISGNSNFSAGNVAQNIRLNGGAAGSVGITGYDSAGAWQFQLYGAGGTNYGFLNGNWAGWDIMKTVGGALVLNGSQTVLHTGNYTSYTPTLTGGGASGTWGINITGNAGTATNATNASNVTGGSLSGNLVASNYGIGNVGVYSATNVEAIWAMGSAYVLPANGATQTNTNGVYALVYSYEPNYGGAGNNPGAISGFGHQIRWVVANSTQTAIGSGIWTTGNIYMNGQTTYGLTGNSGRFDTINTGSTGDPLEVNYLVAGDMRMYNGDITMQSNHYLYPGSITAGYDFQKSWYIASSPSWGLYSNTSFDAQGLYDVGNRVYSAANPPPATGSGPRYTSASTYMPSGTTTTFTHNLGYIPMCVTMQDYVAGPIVAFQTGITATTVTYTTYDPTGVHYTDLTVNCW